MVIACLPCLSHISPAIMDRAASGRSSALTLRSYTDYRPMSMYEWCTLALLCNGAAGNDGRGVHVVALTPREHRNPLRCQPPGKCDDCVKCETLKQHCVRSTRTVYGDRKKMTLERSQ